MKKLLKLLFKRKQVIISEEQNFQREWYEEAKLMTLKKLPLFLKELTQNYKYDYGTICHAIIAGALATAHAINHSEQGGITGYQASSVMWGFMRNWMGERGPQRLLTFNKMLYPQYDKEFQKTITTETWKYLQEQAREKLSEGGACRKVIEHWESIVAGNVPFGYTVCDKQ
jgi:hypothetical protein